MTDGGRRGDSKYRSASRHVHYFIRRNLQPEELRLLFFRRRRPEFQYMFDAATAKPPAFNLILVDSFSRFFRDQFQFGFYVRRLAKNGVRLVSITQELGDPMSNNRRSFSANMIIP
jgi:DNA invertase Pin-like site-specific DNA recombinase